MGLFLENWNFLKSLHKYKHYSSLCHDLKLIKDSNFLNETYYLAYHSLFPNFLQFIYLHYLIYSGFSGSNPGPEFNSHYYLENNSDVAKRKINPLVHYLKYGREEGRAPYDKLFLNHIEFIGIPGTGKTTYFEKANEYLLDLIGYKPGPTKKWFGILEDARFKAIEGNQFDHLFAFIMDHSNFIGSLLAADQQYNYPNYLPLEARTSSLKYLFCLCAFYQACKSDKTKSWLMFDEGFVYYLVKYTNLNQAGKNDKFAEKIFESMPKPKLLIHIKSDVSVCIKRMKEREAGIPKIYRGLSSEDLFTHLSNADQRLSDFCRQSNQWAIKVLEINNDGDIEGSIQPVYNELFHLIE